MVSTTAVPTGAALASAKKAAAAKAKKASKPKVQKKSAHPRAADMVQGAIAALGDAGGSSLPAIKKYISSTYNVDAEKLTAAIKNVLKSSVTTKKLVQATGTGTFKLSSAQDGAVKKSSPVKKPVKKTVVKKVKKSPVKKAAAAKKASPKKKSMKKVAAKPPKPKVSKPKKVAKKPSAKKTAAKKK